MKSNILKLILILAVAGCATPPPKSALELQAIQSKEFETSKKIAFAATISVLQDSGYIISAANFDTGFISSTSPVKQHDPFFGDRQMHHVKANAFVEEIVPNRTKVRVNIVDSLETSSSKGEKGGEETPIETPEMYQDIFAKIQQGIFVRKNLQ